jgi:hypothetical protein
MNDARKKRIEKQAIEQQNKIIPCKNERPFTTAENVYCKYLNVSTNL